ncbi:MAG: membrane-bound PQQ-dependent dehydrogenase, glucose/quinate/shikimate family, partial [Pseudomonadota bacterium]|nr:membrane-bound PQQ-dependent dehydrogenase, glucose/quinate/shikimate family [Pseudomonadota bacterium]
AALLVATLVWALVEAGFDWWPLAARLDIPFAIGAVMLLPWLTRSLGQPSTGETVPSRREQSVSLRRGGGLALTLAMSAVAVVSIVSWFVDPHDLGGSLPPSQGALISQGESTRGVPPGEWHAYGRTGFGQRYSPLDQIDSRNVAELEVAWHFHTGDLRGQPGDPVETTDEVTPLKVGDRLFLCTPHQDVIALDATTGAEIWRYKSRIQTGLALQHLTCRGLSYQPPRAAVNTVASSAPGPPDPAASAAATTVGASGQATLPVATGGGSSATTCDAKLFMPTADGRLIALDPKSGSVCSDFGHGSGQIDLWAGMPNLRPGSYYSTSPVVVTTHLVIVGGTVLDNASTHEQSGVIRAFDIDSGALVWNWDSGNPEATTPLPSGQKYTVNSPNSWSISSVDEKLGMIYVPMGNQPPDQWGGNRSPAVERYSSSVVALDLETGAVRWVFQTVHHDLWDYDVPAQPSLVDLTIDGAVTPALVQPTKQGELFVLDRRTGKPVGPVKEVAAPQGAAKGDRTAATQPQGALSYDPPRLTAAAMWGATMLDQLACRIAFRRLRYEGRFTPPSTQGSLIYPGNFGVFNWGGVAVDPRRQVAFTTPVYLAFVSQLKPRPDDTSLVVNDKAPKGSLPALNENFGAPFAVDLHPFVSPVGIPCQAPPWGYVAGADLTSGKIVWKHPNGTVRDLSPLPLPFKMGVPDLGGPIVTAGGVAFLSGTLDYFVRAYDLTGGRQLWESRLPAGGQATPMTYLGADGRQYLLVVAGGHGSTHTKAGDSVIAYALPRSKR